MIAIELRAASRRAILLTALAVLAGNLGPDQVGADGVNAQHRAMLARRASQSAPNVPISCCFQPTDEPDWDLIHTVESALAGTSFQTYSRWNTTSTNLVTGTYGDPIVLRYSFVPDGTIITGAAGELPTPSNLFATFNPIYGGAAVWQAHVASAFAKWSDVAGVTWVLEPNDDGAPVSGASPGIVGVRGDVRIGGHNIDGQSGSNLLAYNTYPPFGDMVLDTSNTIYFGNLLYNAVNLRNTCAHEAGHGLGLAHVCPFNFTKLMEPIVNTSIDGPQHDDVRGIHKNYGDRFENNDVQATATDLGAFSNGLTTIADVSLDDTSDSDWYRFTTNGMKTVTVTVTPIGSTYLEGPQGGTCSGGMAVNSLTVTDLGVSLYDQAAALLATANTGGAGVSDSIVGFALPASAGNWYVKVFPGTGTSVQMYRLDVTVADTSTSLLVFQGSAGENLGSAVAGAGDVNADGFGDLVAGAPNASPGGSPFAGVVRVLSGADGSVLRTFAGASAGDALGRAARGAGDVNADGFADLIVGAPGHDAGLLLDAGRAYVHSGADGSVLHTITGTVLGGQLGCSVAGCGDVNGDGFADFIVGERWAGPNGVKSGRARIYSGQNGAVLRTIDGSAAGDELGAAVDGTGDVNADGVPDVIVGAPFADSNGNDAGRARVHSGANGAVLLTFNGTGANAWLGAAVAGAGDVDGDGRPDLVCGAPHDGTSGRATVYSGLNGSAIFTATGPANGDQLGAAVAGGGDLNGDGFADVVIGLRLADPAGSASGSARIYLGPAGGYLGSVSGGAASDELGAAVALGDVGGDGFSDVIVGAPFADAGGADAGAVRVYRLPLAAGAAVGAGCAATGAAPVLTSTNPVLGAMTSFQVTNALPNHSGMLVASFGLAAASPLGNGCVAYVDLNSFFQVAPIVTNGSGSWALAMPIPSSPSVAGVDLVLQAVIFATSGPFGSDVTNGLTALIGY